MPKPLFQLSIASSQPQRADLGTPYDRWTDPSGRIAAEFFRSDGIRTVRFPGCADFRLDVATGTAFAMPVGGTAPETLRSIFDNSIVPLLANHRGGLFLHGSAVRIGGCAVGFLGVSRSGKTTLAGALARAGHAFLTEDAIELAPSDERGFAVIPKAPVLRLFADSAQGLGLDRESTNTEATKVRIDASGELPAAREAAPLGAIYLLGGGNAAGPEVRALSPAAALAGLLQHSFILDVEDKPRLAGHFERLSALAEAVPCRTLDYPRRYDALPAVIDRVVDDFARACKSAV